MAQMGKVRAALRGREGEKRRGEEGVRVSRWPRRKGRVTDGREGMSVVYMVILTAGKNFLCTTVDHIINSPAVWPPYTRVPLPPPLSLLPHCHLLLAPHPTLPSSLCRPGQELAGREGARRRGTGQETLKAPQGDAGEMNLETRTHADHCRGLLRGWPRVTGGSLPGEADSHYT